MKRLRRWLSNLAAGVSLALLVGILALWIRSYWTTDRFGIVTPNRNSLSAVTLRGTWWFMLECIEHPELYPPVPSEPRGIWWKAIPVTAMGPGMQYVADASAVHSWANFGFATDVQTVNTGPTSVAGPKVRIQVVQLFTPSWAIAFLATILPVTWLYPRIRTNQRRQSGLCPTCGYDLRATPDRCPECGTVPDIVKG